MGQHETKQVGTRQGSACATSDHRNVVASTHCDVLLKLVFLVLSLNDIDEFLGYKVSVPWTAVVRRQTPLMF